MEIIESHRPGLYHSYARLEDKSRRAMIMQKSPRNPIFPRINQMKSIQDGAPVRARVQLPNISGLTILYCRYNIYNYSLLTNL
jgi:hypothetical protein